jgi:hypothetical protein
MQMLCRFLIERFLTQRGSEGATSWKERLKGVCLSIARSESEGALQPRHKGLGLDEKKERGPTGPVQKREPGLAGLVIFCLSTQPSVSRSQTSPALGLGFRKNLALRTLLW